MALTDLSFIFLILPVLTVLGFFIKGRGRDVMLCLFSLLFIYMCDTDAFLLLLLPLMDMAVIHFLRKSDMEEERLKNLLTFLIAKSLAFFIVREIFFVPATPVGASLLFFDIMAVNYYRTSGRSMSDLDFASYVLFFPKLFAGPAVSPRAYLRNREKGFSLELCTEGITLFLWGCGKEVILVKQLDGIISNLFYHYETSPSVVFSWALTFLCTLKVYLYLSSFGDMGRGIGKIFMIDMPKGAFYPFFSSSVREFIKRLGLSLSDTMGSAVSFWAIELKKKIRNYISSFMCVLYINALLRPIGASWGFSLYMGLCLILDYSFIYKVRERSHTLSAFLVLLFVLPAFTFILPMNGTETAFFILNMTMLNGAPFILPSTMYFSAANINAVIVSFVISTGLIYAGGSFLKKMSPKVFKISALVVLSGIMVLIASFALLEGGI